MKSTRGEFQALGSVDEKVRTPNIERSLGRMNVFYNEFHEVRNKQINGSEENSSVKRVLSLIDWAENIV